ncbi:beta-ketoacyl-[acyl-carrier-protein] synthase family protein [Pseudomonas sp. B2M1-30]|uniref:beta-ketoacyl-[acyl-carrier-protein] synthase family protein n=1 Tax=Pseudomonas TaxID=286 RepID=UPI0021C96F4E|nr:MULTISPECIES: beta-ketoacyl-[acyl-carrier-protein] synthase family protein [Pseudomonas]MCU0119860.1 beta-ketoacyl-[acyl-carrier-protein] synthase family protein [Pseudomonas sp. B2M1-30]MCU7261644.1 beta-ketoacyl-[acyl-carrier-protein] synthase family protein [Pseudomonas koreensis]
MRAREVYVSGFGLVAPMALDAATLFERICRKQSCVREHPRFKALGFTNSAAGFIDDAQWQQIGAGFGGNPALHPRQSVLAEYVARQALEHAGLTPSDFAHSRSGLFLGANKYCADSHDLHRVSRCMDDTGRVNLDRLLDTPAASSATFVRRVDQQTQYLADRLGIRDHISTHSDACAAGTMAIGSAFRAIERGEIDLALCGAVELMANELPYYMFNSLGALCQADLPVSEQSRPFMPDRSGFVISEGSAMVVLESAEHARRRKAAPLGRVLGYANVCEAQKMTSSSRDGSKYEECMEAAIEDAGLLRSAVQHVNTHGTSTQANDSCEALALQRLFGECQDVMTFTANKSAIGHSLAGSGAIEAVLSLMSLRDGVLLPTLNYDHERAEYPSLKFLSEPMRQSINVVMSNSFGFGGVNSSLILGRA